MVMLMLLVAVVELIKLKWWIPGIGCGGARLACSLAWPRTPIRFAPAGVGDERLVARSGELLAKLSAADDQPEVDDEEEAEDEVDEFEVKLEPANEFELNRWWS